MIRIPWIVRVLDPMARRLLEVGVPMGPNKLLTVRGRKSGEPRTAALAVVEVESRRWVIGTYGNVSWVRNLRSAGEALIRGRGRLQHVRAVELTEEEATKFFREVLVPYARGLPPIARVWIPRETLDDPETAARVRPVFELHVQAD